MSFLKLPFFLATKERKQDWSYNIAAPAVNPSPVLGPLRKRECQTRQQQIRHGTPRRIGCPTRSQDEFPIYEHRNISPVSPEGGVTRPVSRASSRSKGSGSAASRTTPPPQSPIHPPTSSPSPSATSSLSFPSPKASNNNNSPEIGSPDSDMDWTATPSSSSARGSYAASLSSFSMSSGSYSKGFMMMSHAMGYGGSSITGSSTLPSLTKSHLSLAQLGGAGRRMSSPSISTSKSSRRDSTEIAPPTLPSSSASSYRNHSLAPRPTSALSTSRTWVASMPSSSSSSMIIANEENGYYNVDQSTSSSPVSPQMFGYVQTNKLTEYVSSRVPTIIAEREFDVVGYDKVFAATWVNSEDVLLGTKCNKLIVLNTRTNKRVQLGRMEECLGESPTSVLSRLGDIAAQQDGNVFFGPLGKRPVKADSSSRSSGTNGIASSFERGLQFLNSGRRSSTPSFTTITSNQPGTNHVMGMLPASPNLNATNSPTIPAANTITNQATTINPNNANTNTNANTDPFQSSMMHGMAAVSTSAGVRSLSINPSRTLLAIGAGEPFQVTIYSIPEYEPVGIMYGHADLVFSLTWVTDTVLVSGSRDGSMRVWSMDSPVMATLPSVTVPIEVRFPVLSREEEKTKVRDLSLNKGTGQLMTLTTEGYVKLWDRESYIQISKLKLLRSTETVCLASNADANLFAVGSQSHITLIDPRTSGLVHETESCDEGWGVRALDFKSHIITTGGGFGRIGYYDLRAQRYLDGFDNGQSDRRYQDIGSGWLNRETTYAGSITGITIRNAVYTMQYDSTGTRLFTAGGPLQLGLCGSYAGLWS